MDYVWLVGTSLFVASIGSTAYLLNHYNAEITEWYIRLLNEWAREDYLEDHRVALMNDLCHNDLTIYIDRELDTTHATKRELALKEGKTYFWHLEKSHEIAKLADHALSFNAHFVRKLIEEFCCLRWVALSQLFGECKPIKEKVIRLIMLAKQPKIDTKTRKRQRKKILSLQ